MKDKLIHVLILSCFYVAMIYLIATKNIVDNVFAKCILTFSLGVLFAASLDDL